MKQNCPTPLGTVTDYWDRTEAQTRQAIADLQAWIAEHPEDVDAHYWCGRAHMSLFEKDAAVEHFSSCGNLGIDLWHLHSIMYSLPEHAPTERTVAAE